MAIVQSSSQTAIAWKVLKYALLTTGALIMVVPFIDMFLGCLLYTSPSPRDLSTSRMPSSA